MIKYFKIFIRLILKITPLIYFPKLNVILNRLLGYKININCRIYSSVDIRGKINVEIEEFTFIGHQTKITGGADGIIKIGKNCDISDNVSIFCGTHLINKLNAANRIAGLGISKNITIGNGVWVGYGALILPGVEIGDFSIIAAGTVVHKSVPSNTLVAGNPMKIIRNLL